jgi:hypothetical protein
MRGPQAVFLEPSLGSHPGALEGNCRTFCAGCRLLLMLRSGFLMVPATGATAGARLSAGVEEAPKEATVSATVSLTF